MRFTAGIVIEGSTTVSGAGRFFAKDVVKASTSVFFLSLFRLFSGSLEEDAIAWMLLDFPLEANMSSISDFGIRDVDEEEKMFEAGSATPSGLGCAGGHLPTPGRLLSQSNLVR